MFAQYDIEMDGFLGVVELMGKKVCRDEVLPLSIPGDLTP
jgi:hypothetical protein